MRQPRRSAKPLIILLFVMIGALPAWSQCTASVPVEDFVYLFGVADSVRSDADLLSLLDNPTLLQLAAVPAPNGDPSSTVVTTEIHVLYPIDARSIVETLNDTESLTSFIPDLAIQETLCQFGPGMFKQFQRTEFTVLFFTFGTEYLIDVYYTLNGPDEYGSYWGMYDSPDGKLAYQYGSWYFKSVVIAGRHYTYIRHFTLNGVKSRVPGLRRVIQLSAGDRVAGVLNALYHEAVRRYGTSQIASLQ